MYSPRTNISACVKIFGGRAQIHGLRGIVNGFAVAAQTNIDEAAARMKIRQFRAGSGHANGLAPIGQTAVQVVNLFAANSANNTAGGNVGSSRWLGLNR